MRSRFRWEMIDLNEEEEELTSPFRLGFHAQRYFTPLVVQLAKRSSRFVVAKPAFR
jgi:hypothetical protein